MKTIALLSLLSSLFVLCGQSSAAESGDKDKEHALIEQGVLGTVNVLRELDPKTFTNRVTVTSDVGERGKDDPAATIDGGGKMFEPKLADTLPMTLTYRLPGPRTVASLAIAYEHFGHAPESVRLEGSADGGATWKEIFKVPARKSTVFLRVFKPTKVNALRITQEGGGRRTREVFAYADLESNPPLTGGTDTGVFNLLRPLWYADKIKLSTSKANAVWTEMPYGNPKKVLFMSDVATAHDGGFGDGKVLGKRLYLLLNFDTPQQMNHGLIGIAEVEKKTVFGAHPAEIYTANAALDPGAASGHTIADLTAQGWTLQKRWDNDFALAKPFTFEKPGKYNQVLVVWDVFNLYPNDRWSRMELFGVEMK